MKSAVLPLLVAALVVVDWGCVSGACPAALGGNQSALRDSLHSVMSLLWGLVHRNLFVSLLNARTLHAIGLDPVVESLRRPERERYLAERCAPLNFCAAM